jgi:uncharacterized protein YndB with AHSA1/START domain
MHRGEASITIAASPEVVYQDLLDPARFPQWLPSLVSVSDIQGSGVGSTYKWRYKMAGVPLEGISRLDELVPNRKLVRVTEGAVASSWTYELTPAGSATHLKLTVDYTIPVPILGDFAEELLVRRNQREAQAGLESLKELIEHRR